MVLSLFHKEVHIEVFGYGKQFNQHYNQKKYALELRKANRPYSEVSRIVGIPVTTIEYWETEAKKDISIYGTVNTCIFPDGRSL